MPDTYVFKTTFRKHNILLSPSHPEKQQQVNRKENMQRLVAKELELPVNNFPVVPHSGKMKVVVHIISPLKQQCCWLSILSQLSAFVKNYVRVILFTHHPKLLYYHTMVTLVASTLQIKCTLYLVSDPSSPLAHAKVSVTTSISGV